MYLGRARSYWSKRRTWCARRRWRSCKYWRNSLSPVVPCNGLLFSLNFSSAVNRPFMAGKAKNMCQRCTLLGGGGQWSEGHGPPLLGNFGAKFSETSFPHFRTYFYANQPLLSLDNHLKCLIPIILLCLQCSFPKCLAHKKKSCLYFQFSTFPYIYSFSCEKQIGSQLAYFFKTIYLILVNLQAVANAKKCCFRW